MVHMIYQDLAAEEDVFRGLNNARRAGLTSFHDHEYFDGGVNLHVGQIPMFS